MEGDSVCGLLCQESENFLEEELIVEDEDTSFNITSSYSDSDTEEYVKMLIDREITCGFKTGLVFDNWVTGVRLEALTWVLKSRESFGFHFQTAYLSMIYFDRFLSRRSIDKEKPWAFRLLSVACLSLAAKMGEIKVPALSEFQIEEYNFESSVIQRMELLVLSTLEWKMLSITPFAFLHYFVVKFSNESRQEFSRTVGFILGSMREANLVNHRPSAIAAAATVMALDQSLTRKELECKMNSISCSVFIEIEDVWQCYDLMQKVEMENIKAPKFLNSSSNVLPIQLGPVDVIEDSLVTSSIGIKRKRLMFNNSDQNHGGLHDEKQL